MTGSSASAAGPQRGRHTSAPTSAAGPRHTGHAPLSSSGQAAAAAIAAATTAQREREAQRLAEGEDYQGIDWNTSIHDQRGLGWNEWDEINERAARQAREVGRRPQPPPPLPPSPTGSPRISLRTQWERPAPSAGLQRMRANAERRRAAPSGGGNAE